MECDIIRLSITTKTTLSIYFSPFILIHFTFSISQKLYSLLISSLISRFLSILNYRFASFSDFIYDTHHE